MTSVTMSGNPSNVYRLYLQENPEKGPVAAAAARPRAGKTGANAGPASKTAEATAGLEGRIRPAVDRKRTMTEARDSAAAEGPAAGSGSQATASGDEAGVGAARKDSMTMEKDMMKSTAPVEAGLTMRPGSRVPAEAAVAEEEEVALRTPSGEGWAAEAAVGSMTPLTGSALAPAVAEAAGTSRVTAPTSGRPSAAGTTLVSTAAGAGLGAVTEGRQRAAAAAQGAASTARQMAAAAGTSLATDAAAAAAGTNGPGPTATIRTASMPTPATSMTRSRTAWRRAGASVATVAAASEAGAEAGQATTAATLTTRRRSWRERTGGLEEGHRTTSTKITLTRE